MHPLNMIVNGGFVLAAVWFLYRFVRSGLDFQYRSRRLRSWERLLRRIECWDKVRAYENFHAHHQR